MPALSSIFWDKTIHFSWLAPLTWPTALDSIAGGLVNVSSLVTATVPLAEVPRTATYTRAYADSPGFMTLVSDGERALAKAYGATGLLRDLLGKTARVTYVIDKNGKIAAVLKAELSASTHLDGVRAAVAKLS